MARHPGRRGTDIATWTIADPPDPIALDDATLDLVQLATEIFATNDEIWEDDDASDRYSAWEAPISDDWERREMWTKTLPHYENQNWQKLWQK